MTLPKPTDPFEWTQEQWGPILRCRALWPHADHFFTTRHLSLRGDRDETVNAWRLVAATLRLDANLLIQMRQVHGARVLEASLPIAARGHDDWPEGDIGITNDPRIGVVVRVADCVPVLLADRRSGAVAAVHAGWRGLAAGAPAAAVAALGRTYGTRAADLIAAIGPSIGPCCYTVSEELPQSFATHPQSADWFVRDGSLRLDLWRATHDQLRRAGLEERAIHLSCLCTACHLDVFCSYRKEKARTGRLAAVIRAR